MVVTFRSCPPTLALTASWASRGAHGGYCLRSSVSDLEKAITTSSAPADGGQESLMGDRDKVRRLQAPAMPLCHPLPPVLGQEEAPPL